MKEYKELRIYHFSNFYLSSIQVGIQAAHAQTELATKCWRGGPDETLLMYHDWAQNHKTTICLCGGNHEMLENIEAIMNNVENEYPYTTFREDEQSLGGILTNVAIVLPDYIYETAAKLKTGEYVLKGNKIFTPVDIRFDCTIERLTLTQFDIDLIAVLNSCGLAS